MRSASSTTKKTKTSSSKKLPSSLHPHDYQKDAIRFLVSRPAGGIFLKPGFGKTLVILLMFHILRERGYAKRMLVVGTRRIIRNVWMQERDKWGLDIKMAVAHGSPRDRVLADDTNEIVLTTYDSVHWLKRKFKSLKKERGIRVADTGRFFDIIVMDESTKVKNWTTQRSKGWRKLLDEFNRRYILTGSPAPNGLMNLFGQIWMLDGGERLGRFITAFRNEYFYPSGYMGYDYKLMDGADKRMFNKLADIVFRVSPKQLKLPPLTEIERYVELEPAALKKYEQFEDEFYTFISGKTVSAVNAGVKHIKLRQLANGAIYEDGKIKGQTRKVLDLHTEKLEDLEDLIEELSGESALIAVNYLHDVERIRKHLGKDIPYLGGGVKDRDAQKYIDGFNSGSIPLLMANPQSAAHGLNLQEYGANIIIFSIDTNLEYHEQFIQRIHRQGQKKAVVVYYLVAKGTVDEDSIASLKAKDLTQRGVLQAFEERYLERRKDIAALPQLGRRRSVRQKSNAKVGR